MDIVTEDLQVLADEIARAFGIAISRMQVADCGRLAVSLEKAGAHEVKSAQYGDRIRLANDAKVFAENTTSEFWASTSFLLAAPVSFESGRFGGRCFVLRGPTTPAEVLSFYYANVRTVLFDVDTVMFARSTRQLLIATHYGTVVLLEPPRRAAASENAVS
jgi:hypothetical protein